jgi:hypothetical protein
VVYNWNDGNPERKATIHVGGVAKTRETKWLGVVREVVFKNQIQGEHTYPPYLTHYLEGQAAGKPPSYNGRFTFNNVCSRQHKMLLLEV